MPKLIVNEPGEGGEKIFPVAEEILIGRAPETDVCLKENQVSRQHAKIAREGNQYYVTDLESGNGTLLNGMRIAPLEKTLLRNNDRLIIGNHHLRFWETDEVFEKKLREAEEVTDADIVEINLLKKVLDAVDQETVPSLEVLNGCAQGKRLFLTDDRQEIILGRDPDADFAINEYVISRRHAKIVNQWGGIILTDLESKNGTYINGHRVQEETLHDGDRIAMGTIVLLYRNPREINLKELGEEIVKSRPPKEPPAKAETTEAAEEETARAKETEDILKAIPSMQPAKANRYPLPQKGERRWSFLEIGLIGLGIAVFCFAAITLVNLLLL